MKAFNWKKGALHTHTLWSDGRGLPEIAVHTFRELGFDFVCLTDHNIFQTSPGMKLPVMCESTEWPPQLTWRELERSRSVLKEDIQPDYVGVRNFITLKSFEELYARFNQDGEFLLLPGCEITGMNYPGPDGRTFDVHANVINLPETFTPAPGDNASDIYRADYQNYLKATEKYPDRESLFILDHPFWRLWDVSPMAALDNPEIRFFEIFNSTGEIAPETDTFTNDQFWDFVLAHRIDRGQPLLYGIASDDSHFYSPENIGLPAGCNHGWVMVNCPNEFTPNSIVRAMKAADFYATNGVLLDEVDFNPATRTLHVKIHPESGAEYHIDFVTTKKDFDRTIAEKDCPHSNPRFCRRLPIIPPGIGTVAQTVNGTEGTYTLSNDDLYVRAVAISSIPHEFTGQLFVPDTKRAWTQPFAL